MKIYLYAFLIQVQIRNFFHRAPYGIQVNSKGFKLALNRSNITFESVEVARVAKVAGIPPFDVFMMISGLVSPFQL